MAKFIGIQNLLGINKLPKNYHVEFREDTQKYFWYYNGRHEGKKDYVKKRYFAKYDDAFKDAVKYFNKQKNTK